MLVVGCMILFTVYCRLCLVCSVSCLLVLVKAYKDHPLPEGWEVRCL